MAVQVALTGSGAVGEVVPGWSVTEEATPVSVADSSGSVGSLSLTAGSTSTSKFSGNNLLELTAEAGSWFGRVTEAPVTGLRVDITASSNLSILNATRTVGPFCYGSPILEFGSGGSEEGQLANVRGTCVGPDGYIYTLESTPNNRVTKWSPSGEFVAVLATSGTGNGQASGIGSICIDPTGSYLYFSRGSGTNRIQKISADDGTFITSWGTVGASNGQVGGLIYSMVCTSNGDVLAADVTNSRVNRWSPSGTYVTKWGTVGTGNGQFTASSLFGLAIDASDNVYTGESSTAKRIQKFVPGATSSDPHVYSSKFTLSATIISTSSQVPIAVTGDGSYLYISSSAGLVYKIDMTGATVATWGPSAGQGNTARIAYHDGDLYYSVYETIGQSFDRPIYIVRMPGGTSLSDAYRFYIAAIDPALTIDFQATINPDVVYQGWTDKVWNKLKQLAAATGTQLDYVNGSIVVTDVGSRILDIPQSTPISITPNVQAAARAIEIVNRNSTSVVDEVVFTSDSTYRVDRDQNTPLSVATNHSLLSVNNPTAADTLTGAGDYIVFDSNGLAVTASAWTRAGGAVAAAVGSVQGKIDIAIIGPGSVIAGYTSPYTIQGLSITGTGVASYPETVTVLSGADEGKVASDSVQRVDIPFITNISDLYDCGNIATQAAAGPRLQLTCRIALDPSKTFGQYQGSIITYDHAKFRVTNAAIGASGVSITAEWFSTFADEDYVGVSLGDFDTMWAGYEAGDWVIEPLRAP